MSSQVRVLGPVPGSQSGILRDVSRAVTVIMAAVVGLTFRETLPRAYGERVMLRPQDEYGLLDLPSLLGRPRASGREVGGAPGRAVAIG